MPGKEGESQRPKEEKLKRRARKDRRDPQPEQLTNAQDTGSQGETSSEGKRTGPIYDLEGTDFCFDGGGLEFFPQSWKEEEERMRMKLIEQELRLEEEERKRNQPLQDKSNQEDNSS